MRARSRLSIPRRIFLGFALVLSASGLVSVVSFVQHERTAAALSLLDDGYLPLALMVSEARATQSVFGNLLDRMLSERDTQATRAWLDAARDARPITLQKARQRVEQIHALVPWETEGPALVRLRKDLRGLQTMTARGENRYQELYAALDAGDRAAAQRILADLRARERTVENQLRRVWTDVVARIEATSQRVSAQQAQAISVLWALVLTALVVGVAVAWWSLHVLAPLERLQARVEAVARGELLEKLEPTTDDELGRLAQEFERMVAALAARDKSLQSAQAQLIQSERLAAIGRMAAHVSHEVRNPLSSIGLNVELLEEELASGSRESRDLLGAIHREIERLRGVTEEYLRLARLPNPHLVPEYIGDVVQGSLSFLRPELEAAGIVLEVDLDEDLPMVALDESQLRQVILNLAKNAREAMPAGGRIRVEARAEAHEVTLRVRDEGVGMEPEQKARIFDLFYTTKQGGSGLGLPLTQQIVIAHGGRIECHSEKGKGTTFALHFPRAGAAEPLREHAAQTVTRAEAQSDAIDGDRREHEPRTPWTTGS